MTQFNKYIINSHTEIRNALNIMHSEQLDILVITDNNEIVLGVFTMGDFARAILNNYNLDSPLHSVIKKDFSSLNFDYTNEDIIELFLDETINEIPVLENGELRNIIFRNDIPQSKIDQKNNIISKLPVVIMAGGRGVRLDPFTRVLPKPLIPLGDDPIIKVIMDKFGYYNIRDFYISLNDKEKMIKAYFYDKNLEYNINYIQENEPLGTAGSLKYLSKTITKPFFLNNCDIIIKYDYRKIYDFFNNNDYKMVIVGSLREYSIPYGICEIKNGGELISINEKPTYELLANTGLYLIDSSVLSIIPDDTMYDMNDLIIEALERKIKIGVYPVPENSWFDIGEWSAYNRTIKEFVDNDKFSN